MREEARTAGTRVPFSILAGLAFMVSLADAAAGAPLQNGQAAGTLTVQGKPIQLTHAAAFNDSKASEKPVILVLSDKELPVAQWKTGSDMSMYRHEHAFMGIAFWIDPKNQVYRCEYYDETSFPTSTSGLFDLKLERSGQSLSGTARSNKAAATLTEPVGLDVSFRATAK